MAATPEADDEASDDAYDAAGAGDIRRLQLALDAQPDAANCRVDCHLLRTPLHAASLWGSWDCARLLLQRGARPDLADAKGLSPLHLAARQGHLPIVQLLLQHGANPDAADAAGDTPLVASCQHQQLEAARLLLRSGADAGGGCGAKCQRWAAAASCSQLLQLLLQAQDQQWQQLRPAAAAAAAAAADAVPISRAAPVPAASIGVSSSTNPFAPQVELPPPASTNPFLVDITDDQLSSSQPATSWQTAPGGMSLSSSQPATSWQTAPGGMSLGSSQPATSWQTAPGGMSLSTVSGSQPTNKRLGSQLRQQFNAAGSQQLSISRFASSPNPPPSRFCRDELQPGFGNSHQLSSGFGNSHQLQQWESQPQAVSSSSFQQQAVSSSSYQPQAVSNSSYQVQAVSNSSYQPQAVSSSPYQPQTVSSSPYQPQAVSSSPYQLDGWRQCVVINNENYSSSRFERRAGSASDVAAVRRVFEQQLGFRLQVLPDLTGDQVRQQLRQLADGQQLSGCCLLACFVLAHGDAGCVFGVDGAPVELEELWRLLDGCRPLAGRPKLLFVQACRGGAGVAADGGADPGVPRPTGADFLLGFACCRGARSFRDPGEGSYYVQALCNEMERRPGAEMLQLLTEVNKRVSEEPIVTSDGQRACQVCELRSTLRQQLVLMPASIHR